MKLIYLRTTSMVADLLTKGVTDQLFHKFSEMLMTSHSQYEHYKDHPYDTLYKAQDSKNDGGV